MSAHVVKFISVVLNMSQQAVIKINKLQMIQKVNFFSIILRDLETVSCYQWPFIFAITPFLLEALLSLYGRWSCACKLFTMT